MFGFLCVCQEAPEVGAEFKVMTAEDLKHACQARGLNGDGNKADLVKKLTVSIFRSLDVFSSVSHSWQRKQVVQAKFRA